MDVSHDERRYPQVPIMGRSPSRARAATRPLPRFGLLDTSLVTLPSSTHFEEPDKSAALIIIGCANLSAAGMDRNMELGGLIVGDPLPRLLERHIRLFIADDHIFPIRRQ